jgi:hypothetical protein
MLQVLAASHLPFVIINSPRARKGKKRRVLQIEKYQSMRIFQDIFCFLQGRAKAKSTEEIMNLIKIIMQNVWEGDDSINLSENQDIHEFMI